MENFVDLLKLQFFLIKKWSFLLIFYNASKVLNFFSNHKKSYLSKLFLDTQIKKPRFQTFKPQMSLKLII